MINKKTAFIIGAGASKAYGLPTGRELRDEIINQKVNASILSNMPINGFDEQKFIDFCEQFKMSNVNSIDKYLNFNPKFEIEGKAAIALSIRQEEINAKEKIYQDNWMQYLYNRMIENIDCYENAKMINENWIYFCTFNYDRLLEYFMASSYFHTFIQNDSVRNKFDERHYQSILESFSFKFDHVYGLIGDLSNNPFEENNYDKIGKYCNMIQLIKEREKDVSLIRERIGMCERIYFLGYGFNTENNNLLNLSEICNGKEIYVTGYKMFEEEIERIRKILNNNCIIENCECIDLLRKYL